MLSQILYSLLSVLCLTIAEHEFINEICDKNSVDIAFNFIDGDSYPNGVMIRKDNFTVVFNDNLLSKSWTQEKDLLPKFRNNNFTAGFAIKYVPLCADKPDSDYCLNLQKARKLKMIVIPDRNRVKQIHFVDKENKFIVGEDIPWFNSFWPKKSGLLPRYWSEDTDLIAYSSDRFELVMIVKLTKQIFWLSLRTDQWFKSDHNLKSIGYFHNIDFFAAFELNKRIHLLANKESLRIFTFDVSPEDPSNRVLNEMTKPTIFSLFNCTSKPEQYKNFWQRVGKVIEVGQHIVLLVLVISFITFIVYDCFHRIRNKDK